MSDGGDDGGSELAAATAADESTSTSRARETADFDERVGRATRAIRDGDRHVDPAALLEYTTDRRELHPSVQYQWGVWTTVSALLVTGVLSAVLAGLGAPAVVGLVVLVAVVAVGAWWVRSRYRRWVYQVREDSLYLERGVVVHRRTHAPYVRIQHVDTSRSPLERYLGLSTLVVYTAGSRGADISIPGLEPDEARDLQQRVKRLAIDAEGDDAL